ncbi:unnamed protein product [Vitrella brassicaformis CCMP3155]|uniref:Uncharacterized protein n=1 Tax=Vitrella brassicaformis (strain CCMP3155) TaxID=1169540 RepID=A0A0G4ENP5_VITBC|nr:unnamed protein product [Vitrella brassicaformis CCMP3155]|eukprot:CEL98609.1 unnamed protein product [Vitrella brassicaformis CCMP3155]
MSGDADGGKRQRVDGPAAADHGMSGMSSHQQMDAAHDASAAGDSLSFEELQRRFSVLLAQVTQVECDVTTIEGSFVANVEAQVPSVAPHWSTLKSSISAASDALTAITQGMAAPHSPQAPPSHPHPSLPAAHAPTQTTNNTAADGLPPDVCRDVVYPMLSVDEAVCSARRISWAHGRQLVNEAFIQSRVDKHLTDNNLTGLIDMQRPTLQYYTKCAYALEYGGAVWCEWPDFIRLADIYKLTPSTGLLPLIMSPQWMAQHFRSKRDFHSMPAALRQYSTFGHLLNYRGTSLALTKVDEAGDSNEGKKEAKKEGEGGVTRQRYRIGDGGVTLHEFETVPLSALPPDSPVRDTYDPHNPPIRLGLPLSPSFTAFMKRMVLDMWRDQERVGQKQVFRVGGGGGHEGYRSLLTCPIDGHTTINFHLHRRGGGSSATATHHPQGHEGGRHHLRPTVPAQWSHPALHDRVEKTTQVDLFRVLAESLK